MARPATQDELARSSSPDYERAPDVHELLSNIVDSLGFTYVPKHRVFCFRSYGSKANRVIARVHALPRIWQRALAEAPCYAVEVLAERYDHLPQEEKEKTLIHELLHIPRSFGGGFRHHKDWVTRRRVEALHSALVAERNRARGGIMTDSSTSTRLQGYEPAWKRTRPGITPPRFEDLRRRGRSPSL